MNSKISKRGKQFRGYHTKQADDDLKLKIKLKGKTRNREVVVELFNNLSDQPKVHKKKEAQSFIPLTNMIGCCQQLFQLQNLGLIQVLVTYLQFSVIFLYNQLMI